MNAAVKLTGFAALLVLAFAVSTAAGRVISPTKPSGIGGAKPEADAMGMSSGDHGSAGMPAVRGLAVEDDGVRLVVGTPELERGKSQQLSFRIVDEAGTPVTGFEPTHTKRMHMIIVRRDLTGFQHLHPTMADDGTWSIPVTLAEAGSYRLFADFLRDGEPVTLASDIRVDGAAELKPLPAPATSATSDGGYKVRIDRTEVSAGKAAALHFTVTDQGRPVSVEKYLGADGHLVALREGDLAFLHVHPEEHAGAPGEISFEATFPTTGSYRLFLQFKHQGRVQTVAFTQAVK